MAEGRPSRGTPISLEAAFEKLAFLPDRRPDSTATGWSSELTTYRDGAVFVAHYAGNGEWERHPNGDEIVFLLEGETTIVLLLDGREVRKPLQHGQLIVVPENTWHRFESPKAVKVLTVTPKPTDHATERPE